MSSKKSDVNKSCAVEYYDGIRCSLHLSNQWMVTDINYKPSDDVKEFNDSHPDESVITLKDIHELEAVSAGAMVFSVCHRPRTFYKCPVCGRKCKAHEYERRAYRNATFLESDCFLEVTIPKIHCTKCGCYHQLPFPAADPKKSYTKLFEIEVLKELVHNTVLGTARKFHVSYTVVNSILHSQVRQMMPHINLRRLTKFFIDEIQFGHGQNYITIVSDRNKHVIFMCPGHDADSLKLFREWLIDHKGNPDAVSVVSADMSAAYESGIKKYFPNATIVFDHFHIVKSLNEALDKVRKRTMKSLAEWKKKALGKVKYTVLYRESNHDEKNSDKMEDIRIYNPELAQAFDTKEDFLNFLESTKKKEALQRFKEWYQNTKLHGVPEMRKKAEFFNSKLENIMSWFDHKVSNGQAEGLNAMLQKTKAAAYGFKNMQNYIDLCFFRFGGLPVRV